MNIYTLYAFIYIFIYILNIYRYILKKRANLANLLQKIASTEVFVKKLFLKIIIFQMFHVCTRQLQNFLTKEYKGYFFHYILNDLF